MKLNSQIECESKVTILDTEVSVQKRKGVECAISSSYAPGIGDLICDAIECQFLSEEIHGYALADGCGFGYQSALVARKACEGFIAAFSDGSLTMRGIEMAQESIADSIAESAVSAGCKVCDFAGGATTFIGGILSRDGFSYVGVGDCRLFHLRKSVYEWKVIGDPLCQQRPDQQNISKCGGRLGYMGDLTNLCSGDLILEGGDVLILCSDGFHDNLNPQILKLTPKDVCGIDETWAELGQEGDSIRKDFSHRKLIEVIGDEPNAEKLIEYALSVTAEARQWNNDNPNSRCPPDVDGMPYLPGKCDHISVIVITAPHLDYYYPSCTIC